MTIQFRGTNLSGGDVAYTKWQGRELQKDSDYMFVKTTDVDYLLAKGCNFFRILFSWESLQPTPFAGIPGSGSFGEYYQQIKTLVDYATSKGATVCIDIHSGIDSDFAAYYDHKIGTKFGSDYVSDLFVDLWVKLANIFKGNARVMFGITNEPSNMPTMTWWTCAQQVVTAIRSTGATNKILMPGAGFTAASTWTGTLWTDTGDIKRSNAHGWLNARGPGLPLADPANNIAVQVHLYGDAEAGGWGLDVVSPTILVERTKVVTDWARANKVQVFVAEVGIPAATPNAAPAWKNFVDYLEANADVILGFSWWSYGPSSWWGEGIYKFALSSAPSKPGVDSAQMDMIEGALAAPPSSVPTNPATIVQGVTQTFPLYWAVVPVSYDRSHKTPTTLFVWLHGCGGKSQYDAAMVSPGGTEQDWISIAVGGREGACWSDVSIDGPKVLAAIADARTRFNINPDRIILGGYSSGGDIGYPLLFQNPQLFAAGLFENTNANDKAMTLASNVGAKKPKIVHLHHTEDTTYKIANVRTNMQKLASLGFSVTQIEKPGGHWQNDVGATGTNYDLRTFLLPHVKGTPPVVVPPVDPTVALKAEIAALKTLLAESNAVVLKRESAIIALQDALSTANSALAASESAKQMLQTAYNHLDGLHTDVLKDLDAANLSLSNYESVITAIKELLS